MSQFGERYYLATRV